ncbi:MAG: nucleotidyltransferase family protein [Bacteroidaceae bacterium]|nr:nucleotidyltransferase family protein [Bacteroidaceae bacterium]
MKTTSEILTLLKQYKTKACTLYGITRLGLFGSVARGEQAEYSDVDICYEGKAPSFLTLDRIQQELEELLECPVDLVRIRDNMNLTLKKRIQEEGIYV